MVITKSNTYYAFYILDKCEYMAYYNNRRRYKVTKRVKKIDYYTNKTIKVYRDTATAGMLNGDSASRVINQCKRKGGCQAPQQNFYYRYEDDEPTPHKIILCYDLDFELIDKFISIQEACEKTSVRRESIYKQLWNKLPLKERKSPTSGLYFVWKEVL